MNNNLALIFLSCFLLSCDAGAGNSECADCGGGSSDGYEYKEVIVGDDFTSVQNIGVYPNFGDCIRYKKDLDGFSVVEVVDYCCCVEYQ